MATKRRCNIQAATEPSENTPTRWRKSSESLDFALGFSRWNPPSAHSISPCLDRRGQQTTHRRCALPQSTQQRPPTTGAHRGRAEHHPMRESARPSAPAPEFCADSQCDGLPWRFPSLLALRADPSAGPAAEEGLLGATSACVGRTSSFSNGEPTSPKPLRPMTYTGRPPSTGRSGSACATPEPPRPQSMPDDQGDWGLPREGAIRFTPPLAKLGKGVRTARARRVRQAFRNP